MPRPADRKIVLVTRKTRIEELIVRYNTLAQARFYVEHLGADFDDYQIEHMCYKRAAANVETQIRELARVQTLDRAFLPNFVFGPDDMVMVLGQDGLVANTMKYLNGQPVIAINPDPDRWDGILLPFQVHDAERIVRDMLRSPRKVAEITLAKAELSNGQRLHAVNDLFIGPKSHISAHYILESGERSETQSSSGVIVSTGLGSTGWLKSVFAGATALAGLVGNQNSTESRAPEDCRFPWSADYLFFSVREPFPSRTTGAELVFGRVDAATKLAITSVMATGGVIFSDGVESDFLEFDSEQKAIISVADRKGRLVI